MIMTKYIYMISIEASIEISVVYCSNILVKV